MVEGWLIAAVFVSRASAASPSSGSQGQAAARAVEVQVGSAKKAPIKRTVTGGGKVEAATTVKISSSLSGDLLELNVKVDVAGELPARGPCVSGRIDKKRFEAAVRQAQAAANAPKGDVQARVGRGRSTVAELCPRRGSCRGRAWRAKAEVDQGARPIAIRRSLAQLAAVERSRDCRRSGGLDEAQTDLVKTTLYSPIEGYGHRGDLARVGEACAAAISRKTS